MLKSKRESRRISRRWARLRTIIQSVFLLGFIVLLTGARHGHWPETLVNLFLHFDPLLGSVHLLASRTLSISVILILVTILITVLIGRVWCGWVCPLGTLLDFFSLGRLRPHREPPSDVWRRLKYLLLLVTIFAALFGNLTLLLFDPITISVRTFTIAIFPSLDRVVSLAERTLYEIPSLRDVISTFDSVVRPEMLPLQPEVFRWPVLFAVFFLALIALNLFAERFWCRYVCPLGGLLGLISKAALVRREVTQDCTGCVLCERSCPTGTIQPHKDYVSDPAECTVCLECVDSCPRGSTVFTFHNRLASWNRYDPNRRQVIASFGAAVAGVGLVRSGLVTGSDHPHLLRPPGVSEATMLSRCIRCGACIRVCPTSALQPAILEAGVEGFWTPVLVPRLGYCDYSCIACGQGCPVEAIPNLTLDQKRVMVLGEAVIDQDRCIAWAENEACIVCEEMCPLPKKAIRLEEAEVIGKDGEVIVLQRPVVMHERCIGCGICEYKCPVSGEAAIRVFAHGSRGQHGNMGRGRGDRSQDAGRRRWGH